MSDQPVFVGVVRSIIPKEGIQGKAGKVSRIKRKVVLALQNRGYETETVRGIGIILGDYTVQWRTDNRTLFADFGNVSDLPKSKRKRGKRGSGRGKKKQSPLLGGKDSATSDLTDPQFLTHVMSYFPDEWQEADSTNGKWVSFDVGFLRMTGKTPQEAAEHIATQFREKTHGWVEDVTFTKISINQHMIIGVGPT